MPIIPKITMNKIPQNILSFYRSRKGSFDWPFINSNPIPKRILVNTDFFSPFNQAVRFTLESYKVICSGVSVLFLSSRPSTIRFGIIPIIVNPIYKSIYSSNNNLILSYA